MHRTLRARSTGWCRCRLEENVSFVGTLDRCSAPASFPGCKPNERIGSATVEGQLETQVTCGAQRQRARTHHTPVHSALNTEAVQHVMSSSGGDPSFPAYIAHSENVPLQSSSMPIAQVTSSG